MEITRTLRFRKDENDKYTCTINTKHGRVNVTPRFIPALGKEYVCKVLIDNSSKGIARITDPTFSKIRKFQRKGTQYKDTAIACSIRKKVLKSRTPKTQLLDHLIDWCPKRVLAVMPDGNVAASPIFKEAHMDVVPSERHATAVMAVAAGNGATVHSVEFAKMLCPEAYDTTVVVFDSKDKESTGTAVGRIIGKLKNIKTNNIVVLAEESFNDNRLKAALSKGVSAEVSPTVRYGTNYGFSLKVNR